MLPEVLAWLERLESRIMRAGQPQPLGGDLSGPTNNATVDKIKHTTVTTAGGALTPGQVLRATGVATADWGTPDLGGQLAGTIDDAALLYQELLLLAGVVTNKTAVEQAAGTRTIITARYQAAVASLNRVVRFKATLTTTAGTAHVDLYNETDSEQVTGTALTTASLTPVEVSAVVTVGVAAGNLKNNKLYSPRVWITGGGVNDWATLSNARLEITYE